MQGRQFLLSSLVVLGASASGIPLRLAAQQTEAAAPFGIAVTDTPRGRVVSRVYPGRTRRQILMMIRDNSGDPCMSLGIPRGDGRLGFRHGDRSVYGDEDPIAGGGGGGP